MSLAVALEILRRRAPEILQLTERLVRVNSHSSNVEGVEEVGGLLCEALVDLPLAMRRERGHAWGTHLCFSTNPAQTERPVLLIGHHDTVFPAGTFEGFRSAGEHAFGPGVLDMKGGLAIVAVVLRVLHEAGSLHRMPLRFVSVADEEVGSPTSRKLLEELALGARSALVFEAGRDKDAIVTARRGSGFAKVHAHGRAAHAGNALTEGRNAIWALARFVDRVQVAGAGLAGGSISTGLFRGGSARNTVAESAVAECDLRFDDAEAQGAIEHVLVDSARAVEGELEGVRLDMNVQITRRPLTASPAALELLKRFAICQETAGLLSGVAPRQGGGSDANTVGAVGLPVIDGLGPRGSGYHTHDERIEIASLGLKAEALLRFLFAEFAQSDAE